MVLYLLGLVDLFRSRSGGLPRFPLGWGWSLSTVLILVAVIMLCAIHGMPPLVILVLLVLPPVLLALLAWRIAGKPWKQRSTRLTPSGEEPGS